MKEINYYFISYFNSEKSDFEKMISKKDFDDFVERSKKAFTEQTFYKMLLSSRWKDSQ